MQSSALGIESSESGRVPWVRLESVIGCITQAVRSSSENLINNEGTLPFGLEFVLFLLRQAKNEFADVISFGPYFSALVSASLLLVKCGTGFGYVALFLQGVQTVLPIELGFSFFVHAHSR